MTRSSGTVTLLFTDIEASTRLVQRLGEVEYGAVLAQHRRLLRAAVAQHGGREVDCRADELFAVFDGATGGVAAAVEMQHELAAQQWPNGASVRVRIGLHVGEPSLTDGIYLGLDVNRAARICAAGHGGQVLVSHRTRSLVADEFEFRDLGEYTLAGLPAPERIFQLVLPGQRPEFPALRAAPVRHARPGRPRMPRRRHPQPTLADAAWQARTLLPRIATDVRPALGELGASLFTAQRAAERADNFLSRVDHTRLATRLAEQEEMSVLSNRAEREAAAIHAQVAAVERVAESRRALADPAVHVDDLLTHAATITAAELTAIRGRISQNTSALDEAVTHAAAILNPLCYKLDRTRHRGVYRSGGRYIVPFIDQLGADRERDFETLAEARDFRIALRIAHKAQTDYTGPSYRGGAEAGGTGSA